MNRVCGPNARRGIGWGAVLALHALVLMAVLGAGSAPSPQRGPGSDAPRSVMVLLRAPLPTAAAPRQNTVPPQALPETPAAARSAPRITSPHITLPQATAQAPVHEAAAAVAAEPAEASTTASVASVVAVAQSALPSANPLPTPASFARPDHAQCPNANYPMPLRERGIEGTVLLRVRVDAEGRAADVHLLQASGWRLFDEAALQAVRSCRFIPARRDGAALASWVEFPVRFALAG